MTPHMYSILIEALQHKQTLISKEVLDPEQMYLT